MSLARLAFGVALSFQLGCALQGKGNERQPRPIEASASRVDSGEPAREGFHRRPLIESGGRRLLWARDDPDGEQEWFDVTASLIDPERFQYGIGKDAIPSIDRPVFCEVDDPRLEASGIDFDTQVLGVAVAGEARAYPVSVMSLHEVVNDSFAGQPYAVLW